MKSLYGYLITVLFIICGLSGIAFLEFVAMGYAVFAIMAYALIAIIFPLAFSGTIEDLSIEQIKALRKAKNSLSFTRIYLIGLPLTALFWYVIYTNVGETLAFTGVVTYCFFNLSLLFVRERIKEMTESNIL